MQQSLDGVAESLLIPLYMRAKDSKRPDSYLHDEFAADTLAKLDVDLTKWDHAWLSYYGCVGRAKVMDDLVKDALQKHPGATVVSIGCGLDARRQRIGDHGHRWIELDFPEVMTLRQQLLPDPQAVFVGESALSSAWLSYLCREEEVILCAEGVVMWWTIEEMKAFLHMVADYFDWATLLIDLISPFAARMSKEHDTVSSLSVSMQWGSRDGHELVEWEPRLTQTNLVHCTPSMLRAMPWRKRWIAPFLYFTNNRIGVYEINKK